MEHQNNHLDYLVENEQQNPQPASIKNTPRTSNQYTSLWYVYALNSCMFTTCATSTDNKIGYIPAIGFGLAAIIDFSYSLYRNRKN